MISEKLKIIIETHINLIEEYRLNELYNYCPLDETRNELTMVLSNVGIQPLKFFKTVVPKYSYLKNSVITEVAIPSGISKVDVGAFSWCENLSRVILPSSLTTLGIRCFTGCKNLTTVIYEGTSEQWSNVKSVLNPFLDTPVTHITCKDKIVEWNPYKNI